jgi:carbon-monoxide dehydrogenase catalytic subunit
MTTQDRATKRSVDPATQFMLRIAAKQGHETAWKRLAAQLPMCGYGELGVCCHNCAMGPCYIEVFEKTGPMKGVCGATAEIIVARNLLRMIAAGAAAHSDHGRDIAHTMLRTAEGRAGGYAGTRH